MKPPRPPPRASTSGNNNQVWVGSRYVACRMAVRSSGFSSESDQCPPPPRRVVAMSLHNQPKAQFRENMEELPRTSRDAGDKTNNFVDGRSIYDRPDGKVGVL